MDSFCEIHVAATIHKSVFSSFDLQLTGITQIALSLKLAPTSLASSASLPRSSMSQHEFSRALHYLDQHDSATKLCCCSPLDRESTSWTSCTTFQTATGPTPTTPSTYSSRERVGDHRCIEMLVEGVLQTCLSSAPRLQRRHRRGGLEISLKCIDIRTAMHNVFPRAYGASSSHSPRERLLTDAMPRN